VLVKVKFVSVCSVGRSMEEVEIPNISIRIFRPLTNLTHM